MAGTPGGSHPGGRREVGDEAPKGPRIRGADAESNARSALRSTKPALTERVAYGAHSPWGWF